MTIAVWELSPASVDLRGAITQRPERQFTSGLVCAKALFLVFHGHELDLVRGKNCPDGKNCPGVRYSENNSATRATIYKRIGVRESLREELSHTPLRL